MFSWYRELNPNERKAFWACYGGWALDGMDIRLYTFLIPTLTLAWSMSNADARAIGSFQWRGAARMTAVRSLCSLGRSARGAGGDLECKP